MSEDGDQGPRHVFLPDLLAFSVPPHNAIYYRGLACFRVRVFFSDRIDLDIFGIVHIDKFLVYIRAIRSWIIQGGVKFTRLVSNLNACTIFNTEYEVLYCYTHLSEESTSASISEIYVNIMILAADRFLNERLFHHDTVDDDGVSILP